MNVVQFFKIIWARRLVILGAIGACFAVALIVVQVVPPRYAAQTQVMLNVIKPDPVTGHVLPTTFLKVYTKSQMELVRGEQVAKAVVADLGWAKDPKYLREYQKRGADDQRDFETWASDRVMEGVTARVIDASNILDLGYSAKDPVTAKRVTDALSKAYISTTLEQRRTTARRDAGWYTVQAERARTELIQAEAKKSDFERANGILLQDNQIDLDSARLSALAASAAAPVISAPAVASPTAIQLAQLEAQLAQASKSLGPNHPQLQEMRTRRDLLAAQATQERSGAGTAAATAQATASMLESQKQRVMGQRALVEQLRLLQSDVELRRAQYNRAASRAAELQQEAEVADAGVTPLGAATTPQSPEFPNKPLILIGAATAGAALGLIAALILELLGRRVRNLDDLRIRIDAPVLGIVSHSGDLQRLTVMQRLQSRIALLKRRTRTA